MLLFPKNNFFQIRKAYVEPGQIVQCSNCYDYLPAGSDYDSSNPLCSRCYWI